MPTTLEELRKQSRELQEKMFSLERYQTDFRSIYGELNYRKYHHQPVETQEKELQTAKRQLMQEYNIRPESIRKVLAKYDLELCTLVRTIKELEQNPTLETTNLRQQWQNRDDHEREK